MEALALMALQNGQWVAWENVTKRATGMGREIGVEELWVGVGEALLGG